MGELCQRNEEPVTEASDLDVRSLSRLPAPEYCVRCGSDRSVSYGYRNSCRNCGATWQAG